MKRISPRECSSSRSIKPTAFFCQCESALRVLRPATELWLSLPSGVWMQRSCALKPPCPVPCTGHRSWSRMACRDWLAAPLLPARLPGNPSEQGLQVWELRSHHTGRGSPGCRLWECRAQQLRQSFVFSPPELAVAS